MTSNCSPIWLRRSGRSPDRGDAGVMLFAGPRALRSQAGMDVDDVSRSDVLTRRRERALQRSELGEGDASFPGIDSPG